LNRIVHRAMAKRPEDRYPTAAAMANDLRGVMLISDAAAPVVARRITRMIALPLRILRSDPETDFLAYAIPEAITTTLAGVGSLIVRSSASAARLGDLDPKQLAETADVDVALTGTLLRAGDQIRVNSQLVELPSGTVIWSQASQTTMSDVFELQDRLTQKIVSSLELPLSEREARLVRRDVPASPRAHEFYLRAGQQSERPDGWEVARDLYRRALDEDPRYAPAWARLARIYLLLGKYGNETAKYYDLAESAARQALDLNPDLAAGHDSYAKIEVATGRAKNAMLRLLDRVQHGSTDPYVFSGLVMACRYCGLLEASAAAHEQARRLDPHISTSAAHTYWMMGRYEDALAAVDRERDMGGDEAFIHESMGNLDAAVAVVESRQRQVADRPSEVMEFLEGFRRALLRDRSVVQLFERRRSFSDPEGQYYMGRALVRIEAFDVAIEFLARAERDGFFCFPAFEHDPWLDPLRPDPRFLDILRRAEQRTRDAARAFEDHPGSRVIRVG
jgi:TolB-like protein